MRTRGFTLIELMCALLILALLAVLSFRGLGAVLDARDHVRHETDKWGGVAAFFSRFQHDVQLSSPRPVLANRTRLEFHRFATAEGNDAPRRVAYVLNDRREVELWLWPNAEGAPERYPVLRGVAELDLEYLSPELAWLPAWPRGERDPALPQAVKLHLVLASGEDLLRVFALR